MKKRTTSGIAAWMGAWVALAPLSPLMAADEPGLPAHTTTTATSAAPQPDGFSSYVSQHATYQALAPDQRGVAAQMLAAMDTLFGRYDDARRHYDDVFHPKPLACPGAPFEQAPLAHAATVIAGSSRILLINESHSKVQTRAAVIGLLPALRRAGFTDLALESLDPAGPVARKGHGVTRSDLRDDAASGYYLRDPVEAKLIETSQASGFGLVAYESDDVDHESREAAQANHLAQWLNAHPKGRLVVVAGHSHIWKSDGWMAEKLSALLHENVPTIDQNDGVEGCVGSASKTGPVIWMSKSGKPWSAHPERVTATVTWRASDRRDDPTTWLTLGDMRKRVPVENACQGARPCLVEAVASDAPGSVPEDRHAAFEPGEPTILYLAPGAYVVRELTKATTRGHDVQVFGNGRVTRAATSDAPLSLMTPGK